MKLQQDVYKRQVEDILRKAKHFDVDVTTVPRKTLDDKSERGSHQGVMAETKPHAYVDITEIERAAEVYAEEMCIRDSALPVLGISGI